MHRNRVSGRVGLVLVFLVATAIASSAQAFETLLTFSGSNGEHPFAPLLQGSDGDLYGTTAGNLTSDAGTVFRITAAGDLTTLHSFQGSDGFTPYGGLLQATDGHFYGTTYSGGANNEGTVFRISLGGQFAVLHSFCANGCEDGANPVPGLSQGTDGRFYGTAMSGGNGYGTVFRMSQQGNVTVLHAFASTDGASPEGGLTQATDGNFYGTTYAGGQTSTCFTSGCGTVFKITPGGVFTSLYEFCAESYCPDGSNPVGTLAAGTDGALYGTTSTGGDYSLSCIGGCGTVFRITPAGKLTTLYRFCPQTGCADGTLPTGNLVQATDGNLYGTALIGGSGYNCSAYGPGCGTLFKITPEGQFTLLYSFGFSDPGSPWAGLVQDTDGSFYGTSTGGTVSLGTVFTLSTGLSPFVKSLPGAGKVGARVGILGNDLSAATQVTFNGTAAQFTVQSSTLILTHVPSGATTGKIQVTLPGGTLSSNVPFYVLK